MENDNPLKQKVMPRRDWMVKESDLEKDDYEYRVLHAVLDKSCIVSGCAGSGKSVLALIKAQRIQREKKTSNYQIIVFTRTLCKYMNAGRNELELKKQFTYHWRFKKDGCPTSDYMIVDEIQDFTKDEIMQFINSTNKHFFFFGDTAQSIYGGLKDTMPVNRISSIVPNNKDFEIFNLLYNYRLPLPVAKVVQYVGVGLPPFSESIYKSSETAIPRIIRYKSFDDQMDAVAKMINNGNVSDVGILTPYNIGVKRLSDILNKRNIDHETKYDVYEDEYGNEVYERESNGKSNKWIRTVDNLDFTTDNPKVMTYHSAKGLQFGTVFLPGVTAPVSHNNDGGISERKALYVAMTRTYRNLFVMYSGSLPSPLSGVPKELYKTTEKDIVEDI